MACRRRLRIRAARTVVLNERRIGPLPLSFRSCGAFQVQWRFGPVFPVPAVQPSWAVRLLSSSFSCFASALLRVRFGFRVSVPARSE